MNNRPSEEKFFFQIYNSKNLIDSVNQGNFPPEVLQMKYRNKNYNNEVIPPHAYKYIKIKGALKELGNRVVIFKLALDVRVDEFGNQLFSSSGNEGLSAEEFRKLLRKNKIGLPIKDNVNDLELLPLLTFQPNVDENILPPSQAEKRAKSPDQFEKLLDQLLFYPDDNYSGKEELEFVQSPREKKPKLNNTPNSIDNANQTILNNLPQQFTYPIYSSPFTFSNNMNHQQVFYRTDANESFKFGLK